MPLFELQDVICNADGRTILRVDHLAIDEGVYIAMCGPSGSGKTTLLSLLAGLRRPEAGNIFFKGQSLTLLDDTALDLLRGESFGFVMQGFHLIRHLSVLDNMRLARYAAGLAQDDRKINSVLERLGVFLLAQARASTLSFGEAQRVAVARAVINDPAVIFADEPTSALDDKNAHEVIALLREQAEQTGATLVVATHDQRITSQFSRMIYIQNGQVAA